MSEMDNEYYEDDMNDNMDDYSNEDLPDIDPNDDGSLEDLEYTEDDINNDFVDEDFEDFEDTEIIDFEEDNIETDYNDED